MKNYFLFLVVILFFSGCLTVDRTREKFCLSQGGHYEFGHYFHYFDGSWGKDGYEERCNFKNDYEVIPYHIRNFNDLIFPSKTTSIKDLNNFYYLEMIPVEQA